MKAPTHGQARELLRLCKADALIVVAFEGGKAMRTEVALAAADPAAIEPTRELAAKMLEAVGGMVVDRSKGSA